MKKNVTYVDRDKFEAIVRKLKLPMLEQAGFVKVSGRNGRQAYVARTKRVGRVDLSCFTCEVPGVRTLDVLESFGNVKQEIDFSRSEAEILETFEAVLRHMRDLPQAEKQKRVAPMATTKRLPPKPATATKPKTDRIAALRARAEKLAAKLTVAGLPAPAPEALPAPASSPEAPAAQEAQASL